MMETDQAALGAVTSELTKAMAQRADELLEARSMQVVAANGFTAPKAPSTYDHKSTMMKLPRKMRQPDGSWQTLQLDYLQVKDRIAWFRAEHPDWRLSGELVPELCDTTMGRYVARAEIAMPVVDAQGSIRYEVLSVDYGTEEVSDWKDAPEKAVTKSKGRCLASMGYGTIESLDFEYERESTKDYPAVDTAVDSQPRKNHSSEKSHLVDEALKLGATPVAEKAPTPIAQHRANRDQTGKLDKIQAELRRMRRPDGVSGLRWQKLIRGYEIPAEDPDGPDGDPVFDLPRYFMEWRLRDATMTLFIEVTGFDVTPEERKSGLGVMKAIARYLAREDAEPLAVRLPYGEQDPGAQRALASTAGALTRQRAAAPQPPSLPDADFAFSN